MKTVQYKSSSALTSTDFLAAECTCKAGDDNTDANNLGTCRIICTHCVTVAVQLSLLMFRGFSEHVLCSLRRRLRRETTLDEIIEQQLQHDILLLIKASGQQPPVLYADTTIADMLESYAESTSRSKMAPGEPNVRDLGLLRDKVRYSRVEAKAERLMKREDNESATTSSGGGEDWVNSDDQADGSDNLAIPNTPKGTATREEYENASLAQKGLSLLFGRDNQYKQLNAREEFPASIGFRLLQLRATRSGSDAEIFDYNAQHEPVEQMSMKWNRLLTESASRREWTKKKRKAAREPERTSKRTTPAQKATK